jgi:hypothetical protein
VSPAIVSGAFVRLGRSPCQTIDPSSFERATTFPSKVVVKTRSLEMVAAPSAIAGRVVVQRTRPLLTSRATTSPVLPSKSNVPVAPP